MEHLIVTHRELCEGFLHIHGHKKPELLDQLNAEISAQEPNITSVSKAVSFVCRVCSDVLDMYSLNYIRVAREKFDVSIATSEASSFNDIKGKYAKWSRDFLLVFATLKLLQRSVN